MHALPSPDFPQHMAFLAKCAQEHHQELIAEAARERLLREAGSKAAGGLPEKIAALIKETLKQMQSITASPRLAWRRVRSEHIDI